MLLKYYCIAREFHLNILIYMLCKYIVTHFLDRQDIETEHRLHSLSLKAGSVL